MSQKSIENQEITDFLPQSLIYTVTTIGGIVCAVSTSIHDIIGGITLASISGVLLYKKMK